MRAELPGTSRFALPGLAHLIWLAGLWVALAPQPALAAAACTTCHSRPVRGAHATIACVACHTASGDFRRVSAAPSATGCNWCHPGANQVFLGPMAHRKAERAFAEAAFARRDGHFFEKSCTGCHVKDCLDCHGPDGHDIARPGSDGCHSCHRGYFVGADYLGRAPREDNLRYQRGLAFDGERYLKMRPDVHAEAGLRCGACHSMASLAGGQRAARTCTDCHRPSMQVLEHRIGGHLEALECWACHSAWAAQEYGTFFVRVGDSPAGEHFSVKRQPGSEYLRSAYLRRQDAPPLGRDEGGKVSPVRPQFIAYTSDLRGPGGEENVLLAAQWKAFFPHTIRRGTVVCEGCHEAPRRFLVEPEGARIYLPAEDGLALPSFWNQQGQTLVNGRFLTPAEVARLGAKSPAYRRGTIEKWQKLVQSVEGSSRR